MSDATTATVAEAVPERLNLPYHAIIGAAIGLVALFTLWAWPVAILTGMVIGRDQAERARGQKPRAATTIVRILAVTGGVLAMLFFGALFGGLIAFVIVALAAFSERLAAGASPTDQTIARILVLVVAIVVWLVLALVLNLKVSLNIG